MIENRDVLIAFPAYNEGKYIARLVQQAQAYGKVAVVDDGSTDETSWEAISAGAELVCHKTNMEYGRAIQSILDYARSKILDVLVIIDADDQHDPDEIPLLVGAIRNGYDMVIGSRNSKDIPRMRRVGGWALSIATGILAGRRDSRRVRDSQSGFRAYSRRAVEAIRPKETGMGVSSEITAIAIRAGLRVTEVPVSVQYTDDSSTHNPWKQGFYTLWRVVVMITRRRY